MMLAEAPLEMGPLERVLFAAGLWASAGRVFGEPSETARLLAEQQADGALIIRSFKEKMLPTVFEFAQANGFDTDPDFAALSWAIRVGNKALYKHLSPVIDALQAADIEVMLLKGADLALTAYPPHLPRMMHDIDVLVKPSDLDRAVAAFFAAGYVQGRFDRRGLCIVPLSDDEQRAPINHYELPAFRKLIRLPSLDACAPQIQKYLPVLSAFHVSEGEVFLALKYDLHFNISRKFSLGDLWHRPRQFRLPSGQTVFGQSPADLLWFLSVRTYYETLHTNLGCMRQFFDVLAAAHTFREALDWDRVTDIARRYNLHSAFFYTLWHVNELLGDCVPPEVIAFCNPSRAGVSRHHDWGDFTPKLFSTAVVGRILPRDGAS